MKDACFKQLPQDFPWRDRLHFYDTLPSTNTRAKELAEAGCPTGTVVMAASQTAGRGRMGRRFASPGACGLYLSVVLRPQGALPMHLTCAAGVAAMEAVKKTCGIRPGLKWINDLCWENRKLGGILTEGSLQGANPYLVVGIGINCRTPDQGYPEEIAQIAVSLSEACGEDVDPGKLAGALLVQLEKMWRDLFCRKDDLMASYRDNCITLGKEIQVIRGECVRPGKALTLSDDGALLVEYPDGSQELVNSGEVSVRGMYGYL